jgi:hypothetical protein
MHVHSPNHSSDCGIVWKCKPYFRCSVKSTFPVAAALQARWFHPPDVRMQLLRYLQNAASAVHGPRAAVQLQRTLSAMQLQQTHTTVLRSC